MLESSRTEHDIQPATALLALATASDRPAPWR